MGKVCEFCGKGPMTGNNVSHSNQKTKRRWLPNIQHMKLTIKGTTAYRNICTSCLRTQKAAV
ncbi:50S ribosomal protein L28 [Candidatus Desantisbacteria bacterium CG2_30_40_21]|uniref:Large ribosomal subunit protein bL28 n=5 Tax=unclassified Candidatus Desantisiibacteriota TaxID=3106372 RepID=A0A2M7JB23_9BACT|nr:MAG: 50S ribosomal protein L28 [Candidatus Desantisbacteria bacterium CG2_30_40_21]PIP41304.1 MAG: 50S ribosomal protein L28 [Candidatus Desantisbacteria bacterium CG23_combo_of_CG06-09_8_20_14_all_40_23]PIX16577.1 MAG: 50S ribosomal protein L28 [Candidatus Desantisbacteria bacterium CG_4_8_14_3_um_filter_40_12]PIY19721.1 MAG: 50S ribosomal protein L28 [Candidatus Desantisbacteria bacterium CG_4_10_14_3_um_filter_40_18]PJB28526.1 MAG: 50S ribosomal protein L28 [Candidatus Desantisbacteria ba